MGHGGVFTEQKSENTSKWRLLLQLGVKHAQHTLQVVTRVTSDRHLEMPLDRVSRAPTRRHAQQWKLLPAGRSGQLWQTTGDWPMLEPGVGR